MKEKRPIPPRRNNSSADSSANQSEKQQSELEERIYSIIGQELLSKEYLPSSYAEAVLRAAGDENLVFYNYAQIRYRDLYNTATIRRKLSSDLKGIS